MNRQQFPSKAVALLVFVAITAGGTAAVAVDTESAELRKAVTLIEEYRTPGLESELSGIYPHPSDPDLYYVLANSKPPYRNGQKPMLPAQYRGKLLVANREGAILKGIHVADDDFGGMTIVDGYAYIALTNGAEIVKTDLETGRILARFPLPSPAGGLEYDADRGMLIAQLYVGHPHLAVVDIATGKVVETLWSDESAMGLAKVDGDWLCTWASGWDPGSFSELRVIDQKTGKVRERARLDGVHSVLAPARTASGGPAFMSLVTLDSDTGQTVIRKYGYEGERARRARVGMVP